MSWRRLVALFPFDGRNLLAEKVAKGSLEIWAARQKVGLLDMANRDGFELLRSAFLRYLLNRGAFQVAEMQGSDVSGQRPVRAENRVRAPA